MLACAAKMLSLCCMVPTERLYVFKLNIPHPLNLVHEALLHGVDDDMGGDRKDVLPPTPRMSLCIRGAT